MTEKAAPKRHHFVPEFLQRHFTDGDGRLYFIRKDDGLGVCKTGVGNLFVKQHLYSTIETNNRRDPKLEIWFSRLESIVAPIFDKIITAARNDVMHVLEGDERTYWALYMYMQWRRTPEIHNKIISDDAMEVLLEETLERASAIFPNKMEDIARIRQTGVTRELRQNTRVNSLFYTTGRVEELIFSRPLVVCRIRRSNKSFILGSVPVIKMGHQNLENPNSELWLPISSDVAIGIGKPRDADQLIWMDRIEGIRHINVSIARQSTTIAGQSSSLIESVAKEAWS